MESSTALPLWLIIVSLLVGFLYFVLLFRFIKGWRKGIDVASSREQSASICVDTKGQADILSVPSVSVVIVCRNEALHLALLIDALKAQTYPAFELIWVDDHSTDTTRLIMEESVDSFPNAIVLVSSYGTGKKQGLRSGIAMAAGELILVTDADCRPGPRWVESMVESYCESSSDVLIGPVNIEGDSLTSRTQRWWMEVQQLEFATLVASGMAGAAAGKPFMANGANLGFRKAVWLQNYNQLQLEQVSGDDVFLIHAVKRQKGQIQAVFKREAMVTSQPMTSFKSFFRQRRRWLSKAPDYRDKDILFTQWVVAGVNLWMLTLAGILFFNPAVEGSLFITVLLKFLMDGVFILRFREFFSIKPHLFTVIILFLAYPFYVFFTGLSLVKMPKNW